MDEKYKFAKLVIYANSNAPLAYELHSVPADMAAGFLENMRASTMGGLDTMTLEFDTPVGWKSFNIVKQDVISIDVQFTEGRGPKAAAPVLAVPGAQGGFN